MRALKPATDRCGSRTFSPFDENVLKSHPGASKKRGAGDEGQQGTRGSRGQGQQEMRGSSEAVRLSRALFKRVFFLSIRKSFQMIP